MILAYRRELGNRSHGPLEMAQVIGITVAEPVRIAIVHAATRNAPVGAGEVCAVIQRTESILARLPVARFLEKHGVDGSPPRGMVPLPGARAAAERGVRSGLLINGLRAEKRTAPELDSDPV